MKRFFIPIAIIVMASGAAFTTKFQESSTRTTVPGYVLIANDSLAYCANAAQDCSTIPSSALCNWDQDGITTLREFESGTMCGNILYRTEP